MTIDCQNLIDGVCTIAKHLSQEDIAIVPDKSTCEKCSEQPNAKTVNKVTCGLAVLHLHRQSLFDRSKHSLILDCGRSIYESANTIKGRPGTALRSILKDAGVREPVDCICKEYAFAMDAWGVDQCKARKQDIINHLADQKKTWLDMLKVASLGYLTIDSLVTTAIERAENE